MRFVLIVVLFVSCCFCVPVQEEAEEERYFCFSADNCQWLTLKQAIDYKHTHKKDCTDFIDFTSHQEMRVPLPFRKVSAFPSTPSHQDVVKNLMAKADASILEKTVTHLSKNYQNRYYTAKTGTEAMLWVKEQFDALPGVTTTLFNHSGYAQPSVIARIEGTTKNSEVVVVGAHGDSIASGGSAAVAPGADDDASGVANLIETARILSSSGFKPERSIEFMVYAAEEVGLRGSMDIADDYKERNVNVYAVYQIEMSGYNNRKSGGVTLLKDYVDSQLVDFTQALVKTYLTLPIRLVDCGYGCSDHAAWYQAGFPDMCAAEAGPFDANLNPNMHTKKDEVIIMDFEYCKQFAQLALAFAVELSYV